jgi:16S rRNA G1207 methylase RsmC
MTFVIPKSYFDPSKPNLQRVINPKSAKILDMSCGAGTLGQALKQKLNAEVWGVENNFSLVNYAKNKLDKVISSSTEDSVSSLPDNYFDTIIFKSLDYNIGSHLD